MEIDETSNQSTILSEPDSISGKLLSGELTLAEKHGRSKVWDIFAKIIDGDGNENTKFVSCRTCKKLLSYRNKSTSNLVKHKCYLLISAPAIVAKTEVNESTKKVLTKIVTKWVIQNCRPYNIVKDSGLHAVLQEFLSVGAKYGANVDVEKALPHPTTISRSVSELYDRCSVILKNEIALIKDNGFGLTTDIWTDNYLKKSYIALTISFLKNGALTVRLLGMKSMEGERCTSENVYNKVEKLLMDFGCDFSCKSIIVTDRGTNMIKAFRNCQHLACISHLLNNTLQKSIEEVPEVAELSNCSAKLVKYFKKSGLNANLNGSLKSYCPTRWSTVFYMLNSLEENWGEINQMLQNKNELHRIDSININYLKAVTKTLQPFEEAIKILEGEDYATLHLVLVYVHQLRKNCENNGCDLDIIQRLKERLLFHLDTTVKNNITIFHKLAIFLYPPTNKLLQCSESEKQFIENECIRLLSGFQNETPTIRDDCSTTSAPVSKQAKMFLDFVVVRSNYNSDEAITKELQIYKHTDIEFSEDFNVLSWWEHQKNVLPLLFKLSSIILATPASSASSERIFSDAGNLLSQKRSALGLSDTGVNQMMFIRSNVRQENFDII